MASVIDYIFNIGGNFTAQINGMSAAAGNFTAQIEVAESRGRSLASTLASFSYIKDIAQNLADGFAQLSGAGIKLDSQMHNLSAVAGATGEDLKQIEGFARESGKVDWFQESKLLQFGIQTTFQTSVPLRFGCVNNYSYVCIWYLFSNKA